MFKKNSGALNPAGSLRENRHKIYGHAGTAHISLKKKIVLNWGASGSKHTLQDTVQQWGEEFLHGQYC